MKKNYKTIAYFSHIDWRWIKQRPQFLAEALRNFYSVIVIYPWKNNRTGLQHRNNEAIRKVPYFNLVSFNGKFRIIDRINRFLSKIQYFLIIEYLHPDYIWLSHPSQINFLPKKILSPIIYDCMDDYASIATNKNNKIFELENKLVYQAFLIFVSSNNLKEMLQKRYNISSDKIVLLRNGYSAEWAKQNGNVVYKKGILKIGYFGTIGRWFDFSVLIYYLNNHPDTEIHIYGPCEAGIDLVHNPNIFYHGTIDHALIPQAMKDIDLLIMPFKDCKIVRSVDPVKLYEYISLRKNIVCNYYPEIQRFEPFVYFYKNNTQFESNIEHCRNNHDLKYSEEQASSFLSANTWISRAKMVYSSLEGGKDEP